MSIRRNVLIKAGKMVAKELSKDPELFRDIVEKFAGAGRSISYVFMEDDVTYHNYYMAPSPPWLIINMVAGPNGVEMVERLDNPTVAVYITESMLLRIINQEIDPSTGQPWDPIRAYWTTPYIWASGEDTLRDYKVITTLFEKYKSVMDGFKDVPLQIAKTAVSGVVERLTR